MQFWPKIIFLCFSFNFGHEVCPKLTPFGGVRYENKKSTVQNNLKRKENGQNCTLRTRIRVYACGHLTLRYKKSFGFFIHKSRRICVTLRRSREEAEGWRPCDTKKKTLRNRGVLRAPRSTPKGLKKKKKILRWRVKT